MGFNGCIDPMSYFDGTYARRMCRAGGVEGEVS